MCVLGTCIRADGDLRWQWIIGPSSIAGGAVNSSPAVDANGDIYAGVLFDNYDPTGMVVALTPTSNGSVGKKWTRSLPSYVDSSPLLSSGGLLYIGCWDGKLYALDKTSGSTQWSYDANPSIGSGFAYITSTPSISKDGQTIYVGVGFFDNQVPPHTAGGEVVALTPDLHLRWSYRVGGSVEASPAVADDGTIYIGSFDGNVYALRPDGTEKWHVPLDGLITGSAAIGGDGTIYIGSSVSEFVALRPDGTIKWQTQLSTPGSPAVGADGRVYVGNLFDNDVYALDPKDGSTIWHKPAPPTSGTAPAVRADNTVICPGADGILRAYDGANGTLKWDTGAIVEGNIQSSPVISPSDKSIIVGATDDSLWAFNGNEYGLSKYSSWPMYQHDAGHSGQAPEPIIGARLINLAARGVVGPGVDLIPGYVVRGTGLKPLLVRAVGPTLGFVGGVTNALTDPALTIHVTTAFTYYNDNWWQSDNVNDIIATTAAVYAFPLLDGSKDAAIRVLVDAAAPQQSTHTATVESKDGTEGVALVEVYDGDPDNAAAQLVNLSARGFVGVGEQVLIPSLYVGGTGKIRVLLRAVGPGLVASGVAGVLQKPKITVFQGNTPIASNTGWTTDGWKGDLVMAAKMAGAFALVDNSSDSAMILSLAPGGYTFQVTGIGGTTGVALVEVYALPF